MEIDEIPTDTEPVQTLDSQGGQLNVDCLTNPLILKELLEHFSDLELLDLSLVNKIWNYEARSVMKKRGNLLTRLECGSGDLGLQELEEFGIELQQMNVIPFSGVDLIICPTELTSRFEALDLTFETILTPTRLPLKILSVILDEDGWNGKQISALLSLKKLFKHFSGVLEQLELDIEEKRMKFIRKFVQNCSFPALKVLELRDCCETSDEAYTRYIKALVSRAPNLQELHLSGRIDLTVNILEGTEAVLMYPDRVYAPFDDINEQIVHALILQSVVLEYPDPDFNFERFNRIAHVLLKASCETLRFITIDEVFAVPLMGYGISFKNTNHRLSMTIDNRQLELDQPRILSIVKEFDFTRIFPNVNDVEIICRSPAPHFSPDHLNAIVEQADAVLRAPLPDRAANIKSLYVDSSSFSHGTVPFYAEMFPNIEKFEMVAIEQQEAPFRSIWKHWVDLEQLDVYFERIIPNAANLDSVFCGIFPEEVAELRQKDEKYLKRVNIVPVMPGLTCVRGLKSLSLKYRDRQGEPFVDDGTDTFVFSKVGAIIALARCPSIAFSIVIKSYAADNPALTHLKPYASVESSQLDEFEY